MIKQCFLLYSVNLQFSKETQQLRGQKARGKQSISSSFFFLSANKNLLRGGTTRILVLQKKITQINVLSEVLGAMAGSTKKYC
jgi:hypothetical protein